MEINNSIPRVLQVFTILNRGGAESMIMNYYRNIDRSKIQFDFLVHRPQRGAFEDEIEELGGRVFKLPKINPIFPKPYYRELINFLKKHNNYKIIHSHINTFSRFPLKIAKETSIPCRISHAHIALEPFSLHNLFLRDKSREELKNVVKRMLKINSSNYSTHLMSCGKKAGLWLYNGKNFEIINNAIDTKKYIFNSFVQNQYKSKFRMSTQLILGHVGRFNEQKNHNYLLEVFKIVLDKKPNSKLILVGDGELRKQIEMKVKELKIDKNILLLGVRKDVSELLQMMDVFVFPSLYEGLPVTLVEAQAAGLKVFASDTITREVALTDDIEFLSIKETPEYWADRILESVPYERKNNYEIIKEKEYDIEENAKKLQEFYLEQIYKT